MCALPVEAMEAINTIEDNIKKIFNGKVNKIVNGELTAKELIDELNEEIVGVSEVEDVVNQYIEELKRIENNMLGEKASTGEKIETGDNYLKEEQKDSYHNCSEAIRFFRNFLRDLGKPSTILAKKVLGKFKRRN